MIINTGRIQEVVQMAVYPENSQNLIYIFCHAGLYQRMEDFLTTLSASKGLQLISLPGIQTLEIIGNKETEGLLNQVANDIVVYLENNKINSTVVNISELFFEPDLPDLPVV